MCFVNRVNKIVNVCVKGNICMCDRVGRKAGGCANNAVLACGLGY